MTDARAARTGHARPQPSSAVAKTFHRQRRISPAWRWCLGVFLATRVVVGAAIVTRALLSGRFRTAAAVAERWDGWWYVDIARRWYSRSLRPPVPGYHHHYSDWAFFPAFPALVRVVHIVTRSSYPVAGFVVSLVAGLLALRAVYALGEHYGGVDVGRGAALLVAVWPASAVFGLPYSEGLYAAATAAALLALMRQRWVVAGVCGAVASGTRATGVAVIAAAAAAAAVHVVRDRDVRPLVAPLLSACGLAAFLGFGWARTGDVLVWRHAENLWHQHLDGDHAMFRAWGRALMDGGRRLYGVMPEMFGMLTLAGFAAAACLRRRSGSLPMVAYAVVASALLLGYSAVGTRPRMVLGVVPGFVWLAAWLRRRAMVAVAVFCVPALYLTTYLWLWKVVP